MAVEKLGDDGGFIVTGNDIEHGRWLTVRSALKLEIKTKMVRSARGRPTVDLANEISGCMSRNKKTAYAALNKFIVEKLGKEMDKPLD